MKHPKLLGLMFMALTLFVNQSCKKDEACEEKTWYHDGDADGEGDSGDTKKACDKPDGYVANANDPDDTNADIFSNCTMVTYYLDNDGDTFGDPNQSLELCDGVTVPEKYVTDNTDCDDGDPNINPDNPITVYLDKDGDDYGDSSVSITICSFTERPNDYVYEDGDCNDDDPNINPSATEVPHDGIDSDCGGEEESIIPVTIWNGADITFTKESYADWTQPANQDLITENVIITRQDDGPIYNFQWWQDTFLEDAVHVSDNESDLMEDFYDDGGYGIHDYAKINPTGGTKRVRWAILDPGGGNYENSAWENFNFYAELGNPKNFYSFKNVFDMINYLDGNHDIIHGVHSDFYLDYSHSVGIVTSFNVLEGKKLALWIEDENIYLTITINSWDMDYEALGGGFSYTRSTPN
nr:putative metal-binding motif-containing protein [Allomuricauda sp.]